MPKEHKTFQCPVCRHATSYKEVGYTSFYGMQIQLFSCDDCSTVFQDPLKFGFVRPSHGILSQSEIDALLNATSSGSPKLTEEGNLPTEDPLIALGRRALNLYLEGEMLELIQNGGPDDYPDFNIDALASRIKAKRAEGKKLSDGEIAFISLHNLVGNIPDAWLGCGCDMLMCRSRFLFSIILLE